MLEAAGATVTVMESGGKTTNLSPIDYLSFDMNKKIITKISLPQLEDGTYIYRSYKV